MYRRWELQPKQVTNVGSIKMRNSTPHLEPRSFDISNDEEDFQLSVVSSTDDYGFSVIVTLPFKN